jgi:hypothetical protein
MQPEYNLELTEWIDDRSMDFVYNIYIRECPVFYTEVRVTKEEAEDSEENIIQRKLRFAVFNFKDRVVEFFTAKTMEEMEWEL